MDLSRQAPRAARIHREFLRSGERTCIDCHKGIAHELPDMTGVEPGWTVPQELQGETQPGLDRSDDIQSYLLDAPSEG
jgi:cytochrome c-type protein NapC